MIKRKVNLCCGGQILDDWENYDIDTSRSKKIKFINVLREFPIEDKSVDLLYFSHAIEHFDEIDGFRILSRIKKCLSPGGTLRIVCPSLDTYVKRYCEWNSDFNEKHREQFSNKTRFLNYAFFGEHAEGMFFLDGKRSKDLGHMFIYSEEDMKEKLFSLGFNNVDIYVYNESKHQEFIGLDLHRPNLKDLIIEAS
jgi:predicted SAM-dependent methyltransferase